MLSRLLIKQLLTDPDGFQWAATDDGMFRYDGYERVPLARLLCPGSPPAPKGQTFSLCLDARGHLWLGTDAGLFCLTLRTGAFRRVLLPHYIDPVTQWEQLMQPGIARLGLAGPVQQYRPTPYVLMPVPGITPLRLFSASALYTLGDNGQWHEISR